MTHTSYAELWERYDQLFLELRHCVGRPTFERATPPPATTDNQRLEFLGDAVLEFICTSQLFQQVRYILCVCVCVCVCVYVCVRACVRVCVCVSLTVSFALPLSASRSQGGRYESLSICVSK